VPLANLGYMLLSTGLWVRFSPDIQLFIALATPPGEPVFEVDAWLWLPQEGRFLGEYFEVVNGQGADAVQAALELLNTVAAEESCSGRVPRYAEPHRVRVDAAQVFSRGKVR
jgi:hypothetical protein